jgi:hypothetical protein
MNNVAYSGVGIMLYDASIDIKDSVHHNISIRINTADEGGGFMTAVRLNITIENHHYSDNGAKYGGVFYINVIRQ